MFVFGPKWINVTSPLGILCIYGVCEAVLFIGRSLLEGLGHPGASFQISFVRAVWLGLLIYPLTLHHGTKGAACAELVSLLIPLFQMYSQWRLAIRRLT
jgi:O-antigen/teichoic acid export membrane protein